MVLVVVLEMLERLFRLFEDVLAPVDKLQAEILPLALVHERFPVRRPVDLVERPDALAVVDYRIVGSAVLTFHRLHGLHVPYSAHASAPDLPQGGAHIPRVHDGDNTMIAPRCRTLKPLAAQFIPALANSTATR